MAIQFFGQYLLSKRLLTRDQLLESVETQEAENLRLGELAARRGLLSEQDAKRVNDLQQSRDLPFGEAAVELGLLDEGQVRELLEAQKASHVYLGQVIVRKGFMAQETLDRELRDFREQQESYVSGRVVVPEGDHSALLTATTFFKLTHKLLLRVWGVKSKFGFVECPKDHLSVRGLVARVDMQGDVPAQWLLGVHDDVTTAAGRHVLGPSDLSDEERGDLVREFANIVCGNLVAQLSHEGKSAEIGPPSSADAPVRVDGKRSVELLFVTPHGDVTAACLY